MNEALKASVTVQVLVEGEDGKLPPGLGFFALPMPTWLSHILASLFLHQGERGQDRTGQDGREGRREERRGDETAALSYGCVYCLLYGYVAILREAFDAADRLFARFVT